jgi:membrane-associated phospholipid phosphatase
MNSLLEADIELLRFIHHNRIEALDHLFYLISYLTTYINIGLIISILLISIYKKSKPLRAVVYQLILVFIAAALISFALKNIVTRERPFITYPDIEKLSEAGSSSFPSGHTLETFALVVAISIAFPKKKFIISLFFWALLVAYSRMVLGVHYPGDVMGGMIIGAVIGLAVPLLLKRGGLGAWKRG